MVAVGDFSPACFHTHEQKSSVSRGHCPYIPNFFYKFLQTSEASTNETFFFSSRTQNCRTAGVLLCFWLLHNKNISARHSWSSELNVHVGCRWESGVCKLQPNPLGNLLIVHSHTRRRPQQDSRERRERAGHLVGCFFESRWYCFCETAVRSRKSGSTLSPMSSHLGQQQPQQQGLRAENHHINSPFKRATRRWVELGLMFVCMWSVESGKKATTTHKREWETTNVSIRKVTFKQ